MKRPKGLPAFVHVWSNHWRPEAPHREGYCRASVSSAGVASHSQCSRKEKVQEYGLGWCKQHAPSAIEARNNARKAKWDKEWAADRARAAVSKAYGELAVTAIRYFSQKATHEDLEKAFLRYEALRDKARDIDNPSEH